MKELIRNSLYGMIGTVVMQQNENLGKSNMML